MIIGSPILTADYTEDNKEDLLKQCYLSIEENL